MFIQPITHHPPWQDLPCMPWWQPRAAHCTVAPNQIREVSQSHSEIGTYQSSMKWKRFWSLELFFAFVRATAVQLSGIVPSLSMENVIIVEMQRSQFCFNTNLRNSWYIKQNDHSRCYSDLSDVSHCLGDAAPLFVIVSSFKFYFEPEVSLCPGPRPDNVITWHFIWISYRKVE